MTKTSIDKHDMRGVLKQFPAHIEHAIGLGTDAVLSGNFHRIVICGMGGSAISGDLIRNILGDFRLPIIVVRDYSLPAFVDNKSLVIAISYSGNTEETISAYLDALNRGCKIATISSGGKIMRLAKENGTPHISVPSGIQPRLATGYLFTSLLNILVRSGLVDISSKEVTGVVSYIKKNDFESTAKNIARKLYKKIPIIYSSGRFFAVAMKWKTDINENAKVHALYNIYPEFNHNEINGYVNKNGQFHVVILKDEIEHPRVLKRMKVTSSLIMSKGTGVTEVQIKGASMLQKVMSAMYLGLWVSYYLALEYKTDPTPVDIIEDLKKELERK